VSPNTLLFPLDAKVLEGTKVAIDPVELLGSRLKEVRTASNLSLREVARQLDVSTSFLSQIENGKSQPSVGTLYQLSQLLGVPVDELFSGNGKAHLNGNGSETANRDSLHSPTEIWNDVKKATISTVTPHARNKIIMETGVEWQRLAATVDQDVNFIEIVYPAGSASNATGEFLVHQGYEYGYALEGEIEITIGDAVLNLSKGHSIGFDSSIPHMLKNSAATEFRGIWFVHGCSPRKSGKNK
jgi:transcriptional regulator with XRE-family HTH domain